MQKLLEYFKQREHQIEFYPPLFCQFLPSVGVNWSSFLNPFSLPPAIVKLLRNSRLPEKFINLNDIELFGGRGDS